MNSFILRSLVALAVLCITSVVRAEPAGRPELDAARLAAIPDRMKQMIDEHEIVGAVTLVATRDKIARAIGSTQNV